jgi:hypothetical protein
MIRLYNRVRRMSWQERYQWDYQNKGKPQEFDYLAVLSAAASRLKPEEILAMMAIYKPGERRVQPLVTRYAMDNYVDERTVYRLLRSVRRICAEERGLTT